jgi:hypothetical protein
MSSEEAETIYERVARNKIARYEISSIKGGKDVSSIID